MASLALGGTRAARSMGSNAQLDSRCSRHNSGASSAAADSRDAACLSAAVATGSVAHWQSITALGKRCSAVLRKDPSLLALHMPHLWNGRKALSSPGDRPNC